MKKTIYLLIMLAMTSCVQEMAEQRKITVSLGQVAVKAAFSQDREKLSWESGDRMGIYSDGSGLQNTVLEYRGNAEAVISVPADAGHLYSVFPYSGNAGENPASVCIDISSRQVQNTPGVLTGDRWPMSASAAITDSRAELVFKPLTALLALNIYSSSPQQDEAVTRVRITPTANDGFCGNARLDIRSASAAFTSGDSSEPVTLTVTEPKPIASTKPDDARLFEDQLYVSIARQSYTYVKFEVFTSAGKLYTLVSNANPINALQSDVTTVNINLSKGEISIVTTAGTEELVEIDGTYSSLESVIRDPQYEDISEDIIPDFSRVGYHYGDDEIPHYENVIATLYPTGDDTDRSDDIQAALDAADGSTNSVVLLTAGDYYVGKQVNIGKSHLVLRGEGNENGDVVTRLIAVGDSTMNTCLRLGADSHNRITDAGSVVEITESYVPVGRLSFCVYDASGYNVGDRIVIYRPGTGKWIHDIRMDQISDGEYWSPETFHISQERIITGIVGNRIMIDAPIVMAIDQYYGGGYVMKIYKNRIVESGIENLAVVSRFDPTVTMVHSSNRVHELYEGGVICHDENHCDNGVKAVHCEHCWVRWVTGRHFRFSCVGMGSGSKNVTVEDCHSYEPVSKIQGSRRYAFCANDRSTMGLFKGCTAEYDRHQFVTTSLSTGPLVFSNCSATKCIGETGPHCFWAVGVLYDCIRQESTYISVQDSDYVGTGASHGWQGANHVLWNCEAPQIVCQSPWTAEGKHPTGRNYVIGCIGTKKLSTTKHFVTKEYLNDRPQAEWVPDPGEGASNSAHVTSGTYYGVTADGLSLYEALLKQRKAAGIRAIPAEWYK